MSGATCPNGHTSTDPDWCDTCGAPMHGSFVDNGFSGWDGVATLAWPERGLSLQMTMEPLRTPRGELPPAYCLMYRPVQGEAFCFEPITQPIDAFHLDGRPGLVELHHGETLMFRVRWRIDTGAPS